MLDNILEFYIESVIVKCWRIPTLKLLENIGMDECKLKTSGLTPVIIVMLIKRLILLPHLGKNIFSDYKHVFTVNIFIIQKYMKNTVLMTHNSSAHRSVLLYTCMYHVSNYMWAYSQMGIYYEKV